MGKDRFDDTRRKKFTQEKIYTINNIEKQITRKKLEH